MRDIIEVTQRELSGRKEAHITDVIGLEFRQDIRISIRRPRWMPNWFYLRLMRTIVVTEGPVIQVTKGE